MALFQILLLVFSSFTIAYAGDSIPAFLWSNAGFVQSRHPVDYETKSPQLLASQFFSGLRGESDNPSESFLLSSSEGKKPELVVSFIGNLLKTGHVSQYGGKGEGSNPFQSLKSTLEEAASSLVMPYVTHTSTKSMAASLVEEYQKAFPEGQVAVYGNCKVAPAGGVLLEALEEIKEYVDAKISEASGSFPHLILVCPTETTHDSEIKALFDEDTSFESAYSAVKSTGANHIALYTSEPQTKIHRRRTQDTTTTNETTTTVTCDETCRTKASLFEFLAVSIVLLITLLSGLCCLGAIDTPSRFEAPRDT